MNLSKNQAKIKEIFIYLRKVFIKAPILWHFDQECNIRIKTDVLGYVIGRVLSQITSNPSFFDYITHKNLDLIFSQFEISQ